MSAGVMIASWAVAVFISINAGRLIAWVWSSGSHPLFATLFSAWTIVAAWIIWRVIMAVIIMGDHHE